MQKSYIYKIDDGMCSDGRTHLGQSLIRAE